MTSEIEGAIKEMSAQEEQPASAEAAATAETEAPVNAETQESAPKEQEAFVPDDALIERAVKAGMSISDAKLFANAEQADRILTALEAKSAPDKTGTDEAPNGDGEGFPTDEFDKAIKEMEDDGDYDPNILKLLKTMGGVVKDQAKEIKALRTAGSTAAAKTFFDQSFAGLDENVRSHIDAATKSQLKKKFDFLKSAHASAKDGTADAEVFEEAKKLVLGDLVATADAENKAAALSQRASMRLARPGGQSGLRGQDKPATVEDAANELFNMLTK